ncbi:MAG: histidine kinase [Oscillospiraceae bacterium]|nr:histidine kinase [Oscillospiraceae bacterium]
MTVWHVRRQSIELFQTNLDLYAAEVDERMENVGYMLLNTVIGNPSASALEQSADELERIVAVRSVKSRFSEMQTTGGRWFNFYLYPKDGEELVASPNRYFSFSQYSAILGEIKARLQSGEMEELARANTWTLVRFGDDLCFLRVYRYRGQLAGAWIQADKLLAAMTGGGGTDRLMILEDGQGRRFTADGQVWEEEMPLTGGPFFSRRLAVTERFKKGDFLVHIVIENWGAYERATLTQMLLAFVSVALVAAGLVLLWYTKRSVVDPIRVFSEHLGSYNKNGEAFDRGNFLELEQADQAFHRLLEQVEELKIKVYEEKLLRQGVEFDYLQKQIQPHFYLNCLNIIYSMAGTGHNKEIQQLSMLVCQYLRAIFRNGMEPAPLEEELRVVEDYLDIQRIRYGAEFCCQVQRRGDLEGVRIAPLVILTMVENSVRHNMDPEGVLEIRIILEALEREDGRWISLVIDDTGDGFAPPVLEALNAGRRVRPQNGRGIGIWNTLQRLEIIYQGKARVAFSNNSQGGARVEILLPQLDPENRKKGEEG